MPARCMEATVQYVISLVIRSQNKTPIEGANIQSQKKEPELSQAEKIKKENQLKQVEKNKCWACKKKTGLMGFECQCGFTFCKLHRLPEKHECEFNFVECSKNILAQKNPVVKNDKLERI